ncbi:hypothetical protein [Pseudoponticoccus marisrubri]|uniref:Flagellar FliJ protein n=1 Tax=Pseudoponticoccus marisrubri TaxID=1685382 RepID=A0A0W7WGJ4_9RHOB|nr:hypothetical protein [Pseudoponticoccus marisrubri]KUF09598.1 hypothetical protein AVJ23_17105 [Pseudoponticoccus marisrubri]
MTRYDDLISASSLLKEQALERHRERVRARQDIEAELAQIDQLRAAAQADGGSLGARQILGADALWQGWLVRRRTEVLRQMAMARARELESLDRARNAFAREEAARTLQEDDQRARMRKQRSAEADALDDLSLLRRALAARDF